MASTRLGARSRSALGKSVRAGRPPGSPRCSSSNGSPRFHGLQGADAGDTAVGDNGTVDQHRGREATTVRKRAGPTSARAEQGERSEHMPHSERANGGAVRDNGHEVMVERLNRAMHGWANYFAVGQVSRAYRAIDQHTTRRCANVLCRKHKVRSGIFVRFPDKRLWDDMGLTRLAPRTASLPCAKA